jgi:hypothetical protein
VACGIREAIWNSTMPVPRRGLRRARDIGTESSNGSFAILFMATARLTLSISSRYILLRPATFAVVDRLVRRPLAYRDSGPRAGRNR